MQKINKYKFIFITVLILTGLATGVFYKTVGKNNYKNYDLLAKRIQIDNPNNIKINFTQLRSELTNYINRLDDLNNKVSVYYEYLPSGVSININEKNEVVAASLMKLPVVMNLYKASEIGKLDLGKKVTLKKEWLNNEYGDLYKKGEGYQLTIREAAALTLKNSDNTALNAIWDSIEAISLEYDDQALYYLDVDYKIQKDETVLIGTRSYSSILKCLYFACFNNKDDSNEILKELSKSTFNDRLTKYLPENLTVSHKIGTYSQKFQSDCGVFYVPKENYILCVMVEGPDPQSSQIIADISQKVYLFSKATIGNE